MTLWISANLLYNHRYPTIGQVITARQAPFMDNDAIAPRIMGLENPNPIPIGFKVSLTKRSLKINQNKKHRDAVIFILVGTQGLPRAKPCGAFVWRSPRNARQTPTHCRPHAAARLSRVLRPGSTAKNLTAKRRFNLLVGTQGLEPWTQ